MYLYVYTVHNYTKITFFTTFICLSVCLSFCLSVVRANFWND